MQESEKMRQKPWFTCNTCEKRRADGSTPAGKYSQTAAEIGGLSADSVLSDRLQTDRQQRGVE
jgi:hypothetical protein